jgi:threonine aldolase
MPEEATRSLSLYSGPRRTPSWYLRQMREELETREAAGVTEHPAATLEKEIAGILGKQAALLFSTGTMAQQVALRVHADAAGSDVVAFHPQSHLEVHEERGYAFVHRFRAALIGRTGQPLAAGDLEGLTDRPATVLLELPQREIGGVLPEWSELVRIVERARATGAAVHLDGARLWESQPFYDRPHAEIASLFDSVYVSLYKGLEGVSGGVLAGSAEMIEAARTWRRRSGGSVRDEWVPALTGSAGLRERLPRMPQYWAHARRLAEAFRAAPGVTVVPNPPQTPLFHVHVPLPPAALLAAARTVRDEYGLELLTYAITGPNPAVSSFEVSVGENALLADPGLVTTCVRALLAAGRGRGSR